MADARAPRQIATIDAVLVALETADGTMFAVDTADNISVEARIETVDGVVLNPKGILRAQKLEEETPTGTDITITDNLFSPEIAVILQGGRVLYDPTDPTKITGYRPPVAGSKDRGEVFTLHAYTAEYDAAGNIVQYEKTSYPHCRGRSVSLNSEDGAFRAPEYTVISAPNVGEYLYTIDYVPELPVVVGRVPLARLTVTSVAGATTGQTAVTVSPATTNSLMYKTQATAIVLPLDLAIPVGFTAWDGISDITATTGEYIAVVDVDDTGRAIAGGQTTATSAV